MKRKAGVNRRQFLTSSSAVMGLAAVKGGPLAAEAHKSKAADSALSNPQGAREACEPLRLYAGASAAEVAFPLGSIGTGTVSLGARGELRDWEIFNRPAKRRFLPFTFVALWAKPEGESSLLRVVEGPSRPPYFGWNGYRHESGQGLRHFDKTTFTGKYPIARVEFEENEFPVSVSLDRKSVV